LDKQHVSKMIGHQRRSSLNRGELVHQSLKDRGMIEAGVDLARICTTGGNVSSRIDVWFLSKLKCPLIDIESWLRP
jgi:hypothetical protein